VIKYSAQIIEAGRHRDWADGFSAGDGDDEGVSGGSREVVRDIVGLGGGSLKRGVGGVRTGGPGMNGNRCSASTRSCEAGLEHEHGVNEVLLHLEGVADIKVFWGSGRLWWCGRGGLPAGGYAAVKFFPGGMPTTLGG
jgi:hypothetical protein